MNNELRDQVIEIVTDVYDRQAQINDSVDEIIELVEAALTQQQEAEPVAWILTGTDRDLVPRRYLLFSEREAELHVAQNLAGGEWQSCAAKPLFLHPPKPAAQPQVPEDVIRAAKGAIEFAADEDFPSYPLTAIAHINGLAEFILSLSAAKEESCQK